MQIHIPEFEAESFIAKYEFEDERRRDDSLLALFPREQHVGEKVKISQFFDKIQRVRHTSFEGRSMPVARGRGKEIEYTPSAIKLSDVVTSAEFRRFLDAQAVLDPSVAGAGVAEARQKALLNTVSVVRDRIVSNLRSADNTERKVLCAGALQGSYTYKVADQPNVETVNLGLTTFDPPTVRWDDEDALIIEDIAAAYDAFKNANETGQSLTHLIYNPRKIRPALMKNLQMQTYIKANPELSAWNIGLRAGASVDWLDMDGRIKDLFGITWIPVDQTYLDVDGQVQDLWHEDYITFARLGPDGCDPKWFMSYDPWQNPEASIKIEVKWPTDGDDVKNIKVILFDNGLPGFKRPDLVMTQRVIGG